MAAMSQYHSAVARAAKAMLPAALLARARSPDREETAAPDWLLALLRALRFKGQQQPATRPARVATPSASEAPSAKAPRPQPPDARRHTSQPRETLPNAPAAVAGRSSLGGKAEDLPAPRSPGPPASSQENVSIARPKPAAPTGTDRSSATARPMQDLSPVTPSQAGRQASGSGALASQEAVAVPPKQPLNNAPLMRGATAPSGTVFRPALRSVSRLSVEVTLRADDDLAAALADSDEITRAIYRALARISSDQ